MAKRKKDDRRNDGGSYSAKPHHIFRPNFAKNTPSPASVLSHAAAHLLDNLAAQFNGKNNGDLSAAPKVMALFGWNSNSAIVKSLNELIALGFIEKTRQGGRNKCSLYAITWQAIDDCQNKLDVKPTIIPSNLWKPEKVEQRDQRIFERWERQKKKSAKKAEKIKNSSPY